LEAQVARVFVSVNGNDANVCSNIATPCRTFSGGIAQVDPNGEVIVIDSGSYAAATINKPLKLNAAAGVVAFSALAIEINVGASDVVVLRGLTLKSAGSSAAVLLLGGTLVIEKTVIDGWSTGVMVAGSGDRLILNDSTVRSCVHHGVFVGNGSSATIENSRILNGGGAGIGVGNGSKVLVSRSEVAGNQDVGIYSTGVNAVVDVRNSRIYGSAWGLEVLGTSTLRLSQSVVTGNLKGVEQFNSGVFETYGNNVIRGNGTNFLGTITPVSTQ
jgi:hypothetical protein